MIVSIPLHFAFSKLYQHACKQPCSDIKLTGPSPFTESAEIKKRVEYAFTRIGVSTQQLHKVINNAPDVNTNIKTTASYLFKEGEYQFVYDNLNNLQTHGSVGFLSDKDNDNTQDDPNNQPSNHYDASETVSQAG